MSKLSIAEVDRILELLADEENEGKPVSTGEGSRDGERCLIHGIEVNIYDQRFRRILRAVLDRIGRRHPEDLARIRRRVSRVAYFGSAEAHPGVAASYGDDVHGAPKRIPDPNGKPRPAAWPIRVSRSLIEGPRKVLLVAVTIHELGHAARYRATCAWTSC